MEENTKFPAKLVIDASTVLNFLMPDEDTPSYVDSIFAAIKENRIEAYAPDLLPYEISNSLKSAIKSRRLSVIRARKIVKSFLNLGVVFEQVDFLKTFVYAVKHDLSSYDASYLYLAKKHKAKLYSFDKKLAGLT